MREREGGGNDELEEEELALGTLQILSLFVVELDGRVVFTYTLVNR